MIRYNQHVAERGENSQTSREKSQGPGYHTTPKRAKQAQDFTSRKDSSPVWQFQRLDWEGPWGWHKISLEQWLDILNKLSDFERQTWGEIESGDDQRRSHLIQVGDGPNPEVSKRLQELK